MNDQLGGPGDEAQNLFAFPGTANTLMETQVESKMKKAVEDGHFIYYEAKVNHPDQGPARSITMSWNKLDRSGRDIGGGQSGVTINADNTASGNPSITEQSDETPAQHILLNPNHTFFIKRFPWGPFHMPDPKKEREVWGPFLDISWFPAVGNARAFEAFLSDYRNNNEAMDELCEFLGE